MVACVMSVEGVGNRDMIERVPFKNEPLVGVDFLDDVAHNRRGRVPARNDRTHVKSAHFRAENQRMAIGQELNIMGIQRCNPKS